MLLISYQVRLVVMFSSFPDHDREICDLYVRALGA